MELLKKETFTCHHLSEIHNFYSGKLPQEELQKLDFETVWNLHPEDYHTITIRGRDVKTPRWQQAYGKDYHYTGRVNSALPIPEIFVSMHQWFRENVDARLNGLLLNWYDGKLRHYIGKHRDSTVNMIKGAPIVTLSLGEERIFRLRPWRKTECFDFEAPSGRVFVMPYDTNKRFTHEVPHFAKYRGKRISITLRAFE